MTMNITLNLIWLSRQISRIPTKMSPISRTNILSPMDSCINKHKTSRFAENTIILRISILHLGCTCDLLDILLHTCLFEPHILASQTLHSTHYLLQPLSSLKSELNAESPRRNNLGKWWGPQEQNRTERILQSPVTEGNQINDMGHMFPYSLLRF